MKKHREEEHEEENSERWLLTYSDLITLLLALFMILYAMAQVDAKKFENVATQFRSKMGTETGAGGAPGIIDLDLETDLPGGEDEAMSENTLDEAYKAIQAYIQQNNLEDQIELVNTDTYVRIHIKDTLMFVPDSAELLRNSRPILEDLQKMLSQIYNNIDYITFTGHTADIGSHTIASDQISWRLSTQRAITVLNEFIGFGLPQNKLSIQGFAHFDPIAPNDTPEGMAKNRRVEITIYKYPPGEDQFQRDIAQG